MRALRLGTAEAEQGLRRFLATDPAPTYLTFKELGRAIRTNYASFDAYADLGDDARTPGRLREAPTLNTGGPHDDLEPLL
jgi:hypothetical protein